MNIYGPQQPRSLNKNESWHWHEGSSTLAVFNVQDVPLKGEHFLRSVAFILIAYRKRRKKKETKRPSVALQLARPSQELCE